MNSSYKIALIASVVVCVVVIGYSTARRRVSPTQAGAASSLNEIDGNTSASAETVNDDARPVGAIRPVTGSGIGSSVGTGSERTGSSSSRSNTSDAAGGPVSRSIEPLGQGMPSGRSGSSAMGTGAPGTSSSSQPPDRAPRPAPTGAGSSANGGAGSTGSQSPAPAPSGPLYTIKPGDNFHALAKRLYGSDKHWVDIAQANPSIDPIRLKVGQTIRLPAIANVAPTGNGAGSGRSSGSPGAAGSAVAPAAKSLTHIVKPGETLASISKRYYKTTDKWEMLFRLNRETVGADPDDLEAGMKITIPPAE